MFENNDENEPTIIAPIINEIEIPETADNQYQKRFREIATQDKNFTDWNIMDNQLQYLKPRPVVSDIVEDLDHWKLVLAKEHRFEALREAHNNPQSGHMDVEKTYQRLLIAYQWPNMYRDIAKYIRECDACQRTKVEQMNSAGLMGHRVVEEP